MLLHQQVLSPKESSHYVEEIEGLSLILLSWYFQNFLTHTCQILRRAPVPFFRPSSSTLGNKGISYIGLRVSREYGSIL